MLSCRYGASFLCRTRLFARLLPQRKVFPVNAGLQPKAPLERPAKGIGALEAHRIGHAVDRLIGKRQSLAGLAQSQLFDKRRRSRSENGFEPPREMPRTQ